MITLRFTGIIAEKYGTEFILDVRSPREAMQALCEMIDGFKAYVMHNDFHVWADDKNIGEDMVHYAYREGCVFTVGLAISGAGGNGGVWMVVAGIALIIVAWWMPAAWGASAQLIVAGLGAGIAAAGAAQLLMPTARAEVGDEDGNKASYGFNKPVTTVAQGNCVPVLYGKGLIGGFVVSYRITTDDLNSEATA